MKKYRVFLEDLSFSSFPKLMEAKLGTNESVGSSSKFITSVRPSQAPIGRLAPKKRLIFVALDEAKKVRPFDSKRSAFGKREPKEYPILPPFLWCKESLRSLGTMSERTKSSYLCRPFSLYDGPKGHKQLPLPSK